MAFPAHTFCVQTQEYHVHTFKTKDEVVKNIIFYGDTVIVHGDSQIIQYDLRTGDCKHIFKQQTEAMAFQIGQVVLAGNELYLSFRVYEF